MLNQYTKGLETDLENLNSIIFYPVELMVGYIKNLAGVVDKFI